MNELNEVVRFCRKHGGPAFAVWTRAQLREHLAAHSHFGTLVWVRSSAEKIAGVGTVWPCNLDWLRYQPEHPFNGAPPDWESSNVVYLADWLATVPGALRSMVANLCVRFEKEIQGKRIYAHRGGQLVEVKRELIRKLLA